MDISIDFDAINNVDLLSSQIENGDINITDFQTSLTIYTYRYKKIAEGSFGKAFIIPNTNIVVKEATPCSFTNPHVRIRASPVEKSMCSYLNEKDGGIVKTKSTNDKTLILAPNLLAEGLIGAELNKLLDSGETNNFVRTHGVMYDPETKSSYTFLEKLNGNLGDRMRTETYIYTMLFQVAHGLSVAQDRLKFTHYDLHGGNILWERSDITGFTTYNILNSEGNTVPVNLKNMGFTVKIIDFGLSRMETNSAIINNKIDWYRNAVAHHSVYDKHYDMLMFVGYLLHSTSRLARNFRTYVRFKDKAMLLSLVSGIDMADTPDMHPSDFIEYASNKLYRKNRGKMHWRPLEYSVNNNYIQGHGIHSIIEWLASKLMQNNSLMIDYSSQPSSVISSTNYIRKVPDKDMPVNIDDGITAIHNIVDNIKVFTVYVNTDNISLNGYNFTSECCKINQLQEMENRYGFSITAGDTDVEGDWVQINGLYEDKDYKSGESVQDKNIIKVDDNGKGLSIVDGDYRYNPNIDLSMFSVGPIFIKGGMAVMELDTEVTHNFITVLSYRLDNRHLMPEYDLLVTLFDMSNLTNITYRHIHDILVTLGVEYSIILYRGEMGQLTWRSNNNSNNVYVSSVNISTEFPAPISFGLIG